MLEALNYLIKFSQQTTYFVCSMVVAVKLCQADFYLWYIDSDTTYSADVFCKFRDISNDTSEVFSHEWKDDMNLGFEMLSMQVEGMMVLMQWRPNLGAQFVLITCATFVEIEESVKVQCAEAARQIISELEKRIPAVELMDALGIVYPQYWVSPIATDTFLQHLDVLKCWFGVPKRLKGDFVVPTLIDAQRLAEQSSFFKLSMLNNAQWAVEQNFRMNPLSRLWKKLSSNALLASKLSELLKIAEVAAITVMDSIEDERTFSTLNYMKSKVRNNLDDHLDLVVYMFGQSFYDLKTFSMQDAISKWKDVKTHYATIA